MKKTLLLLLAICIGGVVVSQQTYQFKIDTKSKKVIENPEIGIEPIKSVGIIKSDIQEQPTEVNGDRNVDVVTVIPLGTAANPYGWGYGGGQQSLIPVNEDINTIAVIHRMGGDDDPGGYSGDMGYDVSFDGGQTWTTMIGFYWATENDGGEYYLDAGRYPNAGIYDPTGMYTDAADSYMTYFAPVLWGSNDIWGGYASGVANFGDTSVHTKTLHTDLDYAIGVPSAYFMTKQGLAIGVDQDYDLVGSVYNDQLIVSKGTWSEEQNDLVYTFGELEASYDISEYPYDEKVAFAPDGMTGYISTIGNDGNADQMGGTNNVYPIYWKTTDGGENWEGPFYIQLDGPNGLGGIVYHHLTDELLGELFEPPIPAREDVSYTTAFDHDIAVDANGNLHIAAVIGPTGSDPLTIVSANGYLAAVDIFTTDGGTSWFVEEMGRVATLRGTFGDISEDNRIRITTDWAGHKIFVSWLDTDVPDAEDNDRPNIWCRGFDPFTYLKTAASGGVDGPTNVTLFSEGMWQSFFGNAAKYCFTNDNGFNIPFVYEDMDPNDVLAPVRFKYIQDFYYTDADFSIQAIGDNYENAVSSTVSQNYPNPFTNESYVKLDISKQSNVSMEIYTITGQLILKNDYGVMYSGSHTLNIKANDLNPGVYFYTVNIDEKQITKKMIVE